LMLAWSDGRRTPRNLSRTHRRVGASFSDFLSEQLLPRFASPNILKSPLSLLFLISQRGDCHMFRATVYLAATLCPVRSRRRWGRIAPLMALVLLLLAASSPVAAEVIPVYGAGAAIGSAFSPLERAFDDQP